MILAAAVLLSRLAAPPAPAVPTAPAAPSVSADFFATHREKFFGKLPAGAIAIFHAAPEARGVSSDPYRQDSDYWYLTGLEEPGAVAVLWHGGSGERRYALFVRPKDFAAEQWTGWRAGLEGAKKDFGAGEAYSLSEFWDRFPKLLPAAQSLYYEGGGDEEFGRKLLEAWNAGNANAVSPRPAADAAPILAALRLVKGEIEQALLREASRLSADAHTAAMREIAPGRHEYDLKSAMVARCLAGGAARMAYPPIVASGRNSVILHHERDDKRLEEERSSSTTPAASIECTRPT
jgi:Xaa-Pro aminopeptidase